MAGGDVVLLPTDAAESRCGRNWGSPLLASLVARGRLLAGTWGAGVCMAGTDCVTV